MQWLLRLLRIDQDSLREHRIDTYRRKMVNAETQAERLHAWRLMTREIRERSPQQVERMERELGIG